MAENEDGAEKSEEPTEKRRRDAREEGRIITSKEVFVFGSMGMGTGLLVLAGIFAPGMAHRWRAYLMIDTGATLDDLVAVNSLRALADIGWVALLAGLPLIAASVLLQSGMGGLQWAPKALGFKFDKLDPLKGLQRMVSMQALVELGKAILKVAALGIVAFVVMKGEMSAFARMWAMAPGDAAASLGGAVLRMMIAFSLVLALIGGIDLLWQIISMNKSLRMTQQEVKQENKESNGSPEVKGRIRRLQMEASRRGARMRAALDDVPKATAVITNPTHFAVALRYVPGETEAPMILAMGRGPMAHEIMSRARLAGVHVLSVPPLARALYYTGDIGAQIGDRLYAAVAAILAHVYRLDRGDLSDLPDIDLPEDLRFDPHGRPEKG